jgi:hypothetical protein
LRKSDDDLFSGEPFVGCFCPKRNLKEDRSEDSMGLAEKTFSFELMQNKGSQKL